MNNNFIFTTCRAEHKVFDRAQIFEEIVGGRCLSVGGRFKSGGVGRRKSAVDIIK